MDGTDALLVTSPLRDSVDQCDAFSLADLANGDAGRGKKHADPQGERADIAVSFITIGNVASCPVIRLWIVLEAR